MKKVARRANPEGSKETDPRASGRCVVRSKAPSTKKIEIIPQNHAYGTGVRVGTQVYNFHFICNKGSNVADLVVVVEAWVYLASYLGVVSWVSLFNGVLEKKGTAELNSTWDQARLFPFQVQNGDTDLSRFVPRYTFSLCLYSTVSRETV